ncbi:MAG: glutaredoxin domain-containing protein [Planctomycetota bacterium]
MKKITVYSTQACPWCHRAKDYLKSKNVVFEDVDVSVNEPKAEEMVNLSGQSGVPVIKIDDEIIVGFDQTRIDAALAKTPK